MGQKTPLLDTVCEFAFPRFAGTEGERRAGEMVAERLRAAGLEVTREPIRVSRSAYPNLRALAHGLGALGVVVLAATATTGNPLPGVFLAAALLAALLGGAKWHRSLEGIFDTGSMVDSANFTARRPGRGGRPRIVVVMAHIDTKSARWPTFLPVTLIGGAALGTAALGVWCALAVALAWEPMAAGAAAVWGSVLAAMMIAPTMNRIGNESPGAMDNATGVSVLLEAARTFPTDPALADAELLFVATGAEEIGLGGALRWIQTHESECPRDRTAVLNLDSVGVGRGVLGLDIHGGLPGGLRMTDAFRKAAVASGVKARRIRVLPGVGVDTMPISSRGYSTVTLLGRVPGGASVRIHTARDTAEHLCEAGLRDAATVLTELARMAAKPVG